MSFFTRLSNGWKIAVSSFKVLKANKQLIIFPLLSGISILLILGSFITMILSGAGWNTDNLEVSQGTGIFYMFLYYLVNYFIVIFFNTALIHCTRMYFHGEEVNIREGIRFAWSRIGAIFAWSMLAATVGTILRLLEENAGWLGKIIIGLIGVAWSIATFFVVPVIAYEKLGPINAFKRSAEMMKEKWGESLGGRFSFGIIQFLGTIIIGGILLLIGSAIHIFAGIVLAVLGVLLFFAVMSAVQTIFISAVYHNVTGDPVKQFNQEMIDRLFETK